MRGSNWPFDNRVRNGKEAGWFHGTPIRSGGFGRRLDASRREESRARLNPPTILPVAELAWRRPVGVIARDEGYLPPAVQRLIDILKSQLTVEQNRG